jgi:hypothetical protein
MVWGSIPSNGVSTMKLFETSAFAAIAAVAQVLVLAVIFTA